MVSVINLFILLLKRFISNPISSFRLINPINVKTLVYAASNEDHRILLSNLDKKLLEREHTQIKVIQFAESTINVQITDARTFSDFKIVVYGIIRSDAQIKQIQLLNGDILLSTYIFSGTEENFNVSKRFFFEEDTDPNLVAKDHTLVFVNENDEKCKLEFNTYESYEYSKLSWNTQYRILKQKKALNVNSTKNIQKKINFFEIKPKFSVVVPAYNSDPEFLTTCIQSVLNQSYTNWELVLYDDFSSRDDTLELIKEFAFHDKRIKAVFGKENLNVSLATNNAISHTKGDFVCFLDHDDYLSHDALYQVLKVINNNPDAKLIYSDEDIVEENDNTVSAMLKPGFSIDLLRVQNYINHFCIVKKELGDQLGWLNGEFYGAQDYDLLLRLTEVVDFNDIIHIPHVLYHWRKNAGSIVENPSSKPYVFENAMKALTAHLERVHMNATVKAGLKLGNYEIEYNSNPTSWVTVIINSNDNLQNLTNCINSVINQASYIYYDIFIITSSEKINKRNKTLTKVINQKGIEVTYIKAETAIPQSYNTAAKTAKGEYIVFLDSSIEIISKNWITKNLKSCLTKDTGAIGALLLYPNETIYHDGLTYGIAKKDSSLPYISNINKHKEVYTTQRFIPYSIKNVAAISPYFIFISKELFTKVEGFDAVNLAAKYYSVDLCFKLEQLGKRIVQNPHVQGYIHSIEEEMTQDEALTRYKELKYIYSKWENRFLRKDTFFNASINVKDEQMNLI